MPEVLIPLLTFLAVICIGGAFILARQAHKRHLQARLASMRRPLEQLAGGRDVSPRGRILARIGASVSSSRTARSLQQNLARAGYHSANAASVYLGLKVVLALVGFLAPVVLSFAVPLSFSLRMMLPPSGAALLSFIPNLVVGMRKKKRTTEIRNHLPDAVDLLEICVASGMGLDMAWNLVGDEMRGVCPCLADEMSLTSFEIHLGTLRAEAMRHMAERTGVDDLGSLVAVLVESERFGTGIAEALRTFATSVRETRRFRAEEAAEKASVKLVFPMLMFIFPAVFVVLVGPAGIRLTEMLRNW